MNTIFRVAVEVLLCLLSPVLLVLSALLLGLTDLCFFCIGRLRKSSSPAPRWDAASIVIPNWNGRDLLEKFLPFVVAASETHPENEVIVVDNASTDGSIEFLQSHFPSVRILQLPHNLGFGGGSNQGFQAAKNDIVVLLNNDMRVEADFLPPLLKPFSDPLVFAVSCQIFFADPLRRREETGLTEIWWEKGRLRASHHIDEAVQIPFPCAYPGGGSSAFDRRKFLELGGFDDIFHPFYYEDTDLGFAAWKRGWKVLYQPASIVYHEHRGTIGRKFSKDFINSIIDKNVLLYCWKNIHSWKMLSAHFAAVLTGSFGSMVSANAEGSHTFWGLARALLQIGSVMKARWRARTLAKLSDAETLRRPLGGYFRDRFDVSSMAVPSQLRVLFLSPYPIEPPVHGGAVFMKETLNQLATLADVHLISFLDNESQRPAQEKLRSICKSVQLLVRDKTPDQHPSTLLPHAIREFADRDFAWAVHRTMYLQQIDVVQIEYTILSQYAGSYHHIPCILFEHDIFFQSLWRRLQTGAFSAIAFLEYLRMLRYELNQVRQVDRVQVCSNDNAKYLLQFAPELQTRIDANLRSGLDLRQYQFVSQGREPDTILFVGNFLHSPNVEALHWFAKEVLGHVLQAHPAAQLIVIGNAPPPSLDYLRKHPNVRMTGFVPDVREPLRRYSVFVCPVLSGSGIRVKLLEAFASGIPTVSTSIGAEGLASTSGNICELADSPVEFARSVVKLLHDPAYAETIARRARRLVEDKYDVQEAAKLLLDAYRREVNKRRLHSVDEHPYHAKSSVA
jgi:O-antigen biosynthesis protein